MSTAAIFSSLLTGAFQTEAAKATFSEVQLFRALIRSFSALPSGFFVEEYHGPKHQVFFNGTGKWGRSPARCELCDVVFVTYRTSPTFELRVTFLQAKLSKEKHSTLCSSYPKFSDQIDFKANLEQWDLLARRPPILPVPPFKAHPLLLQGATLASVGSFGVFHKTKSAAVDFFYASADVLSVVGAPTTKNGRLTSNASTLRQRTVHGHLETVYCCCMPVFAKALYSLELGTPIDVSSSGAGASPLAGWLRGVLQAYLQFGASNSLLAREVLARLPDSAQTPGGELVPPPSLILIRAESQNDL
jgi:hypothetical protein